MTIYIILIICSLLFSFLCKFNFTIKRSKNETIIHGKNIYLFLMFIVMTLVMSLRSSHVGIDTPTYTRIFAAINSQTSFINSINIVTISAPLYILICRILGFLSYNPYFLQAFSSIFINYFLIIYIQKSSDSYPLSIFLWFGLALFYFSMNGTRQTMSIVLALNSIYYLSKDIRSTKGWIYFVSSVFIHYAAFFASLGIALMYISKRMKSKQMIINFSALFSIAIAFSTSLLRYVIILFPKYAQYVNGNSYYSILNGNGQGRIILLYLLLGVINLFHCFLYLKCQKDLNTNSSNSEYNDSILPMLIFGSIFGIVNFKNELISRLLLFYLSLYISFVANIGNGYKIDARSKLLIKTFFIVVIGAYGIISLITNQNGVVPYSFFFST